jgi:acylphosphatase
MDKVSFKAYVSGAVQGVGFRYFTYQEANRLELSGYVKNLPDGRVEVFAEGLKNQIDQFLEILKGGPRYSTVEHVDIEWQEYSNKYQSFRIESGY